MCVGRPLTPAAPLSSLTSAPSRFTGKLKFKFKGKDSWTAPFLTLLQGRTTEIILRDPEQLQYIADAAEQAAVLPGADLDMCEQLRKIIDKKKSTTGTKAQLKPSFAGDTCEQLAVIVKWGGEASLPRTALCTLPFVR